MSDDKRVRVSQELRGRLKLEAAKWSNEDGVTYSMGQVISILLDNADRVRRATRTYNDLLEDILTGEYED